MSLITLANWVSVVAPREILETMEGLKRTWTVGTKKKKWYEQNKSLLQLRVVTKRIHQIQVKMVLLLYFE